MQSVTIDFEATLERFTDAFNRSDLDAVMGYFAHDAVYEPGDGTSHRGHAAIRAVFEPQFRGAFGAMRFDLEDRLIDREARKATLRWICRHDLTSAPAMSRWLRAALRLRHGSKLGWRGVDVFHFDASGQITGKFTYANYDRPQLRRELG